MPKKPANKGKTCIRRKRVNGKMKCAAYGTAPPKRTSKKRTKKTAK